MRQATAVRYGDYKNSTGDKVFPHEPPAARHSFETCIVNSSKAFEIDVLYSGEADQTNQTSTFTIKTRVLHVRY